MDDFKSELAELKQFVADLKADRAATKEKEKSESWTKFVSLTVVIIAVIAASASQMGGGFGGTAQMSQAQASDKWSYYQSKSIKQNLYEVSQAQLMVNANTNSPTFAHEKKTFEERVARYEKEKAEIKGQAEALEKTRDLASKKGGYLGQAVSFFSVSIAIASICMVTKKKPLWFISMIIAFLGCLEMWFSYCVK